jgi:hypothetical protein
MMLHETIRPRDSAVAALVLLTALGVGVARGQEGDFRPGGHPLFTLDLAGTSVGEIPGTIKLLRGNVEAVLKDGVPMLKAPTASTFLITLPQVLPQDFTLEFDLIPKAGGGPPPDLSIEGTPTVNQGPGSAHLLWQADGYMGVIGGAQDNYEQRMPEDLRAALPGVLTEVGVRLEGSTVEFYLNGRRFYTLERQFARGRVLRVSLGGVDEANAVYLAGLRIATGAPSGEIVQKAVPGPASLTASARAGWGVTLRWAEVPNASGYQLERGVSGQPFTPLTLQGDAATLVAYGHDDVTVLPGLSYQYRVRASLAAGVVSGYSPVAQYATPAEALQIQNLTAGVSTTPLPVEDQSGKIYYGVTYSWTRDPAVLSFEYGIEAWRVDPGTGVEQQLFRLRNTVPATGAPPFVTRYEAGTRGRFCVSVVREFDSAKPLPGAACVTTDIPSARSGGSAGIAARTISLSGFAATGVSSRLAPRAVTLSGFTAGGTSISLPPRIVSLSGWTAVGINP